MKTGDVIELEIRAVDPLGRGLAQVGDATLMVPGAVPGARVRARVAHVGRRARVHLELESVLAEGQGGRAAPCHHAAPTRGRCGGCPLMHLEGEVQRATKRDALARALAPLGVSGVDLQSAGEALGWRNRTQLRVFRSSSGTVRLGSRAQRSGEMAWMRGCRIVLPSIRRVADALEDLLRERERSAPEPADPRESPGGLRFVGLRGNPQGEVLVELVAARAPERLAPLGRAVAAIPGVVSVWLGERASDDNVVHSERTSPMAGMGPLEMPFDGRMYPLSPQTFFQLNNAVAEEMVARAAALVAEGDHGVVWDLYCGVGVLGHAVLQRSSVERLVGVDAIGPSVRTAAVVGGALAARGGARWVEGDLGEGLPAALTEGPRPNVVLVNPPRRGLDAAVLEGLGAVRPERIVYMSCDPGTFARDVGRLRAAGYGLSGVEAWDMMPQTPHVELLGVLVDGTSAA